MNDINWNISSSGLACNADPVLGGIIDKTIVSGEWFIIFNDDDLPMIEGLSSQEEALRVHKETIENKYLLD